MAESKSHKDTSQRIARMYGVEYNSGKGPDIKSPKATIEVETPNTVRSGIPQLRGYRGPVFIAGTNDAAVQAALKATANTTIGVKDRNGRTVKSSTRKR